MNAVVKTLLIGGGAFALWEWVLSPMFAAQTPAAPAALPASTSGATGTQTPSPAAVSPSQTQPQNTPPASNNSGYITTRPPGRSGSGGSPQRVSLPIILPYPLPRSGLSPIIIQGSDLGGLGNYRFSPASRTPYFSGSGSKLTRRD